MSAHRVNQTTDAIALQGDHVYFVNKKVKKLTKKEEKKTSRQSANSAGLCVMSRNK
jgi:hypothetical protein